MALEMGVPLERITETVKSLHEFNPMMGHRGCRLGITYPEVTRMQVRAIMEAAIRITGSGIKVLPETNDPPRGPRRGAPHHEASDAGNHRRSPFRELETRLTTSRTKIGTMIEVPRACVTAGEIAGEADFFSFGTNDLTQMGCGFSRDDAGKFLGDYVRMGIYEKDPFQSIDEDGIGALVAIAVQSGRKIKPALKLGVCGEHGGDSTSIRFFHRVGLNYVSCSPYRVPVARLAAAQAVIEANR